MIWFGPQRFQQDCICAQWRFRPACASAQSDQSSQGTLWEAKDAKLLQKDHEGSDQPVCMQKMCVPAHISNCVENLWLWYCPGNTLWKVMDWSNAIFHGLLKVIITKYCQLSLSRIPRDLLNHFEISVPRHIRVAEMRKTINRTTTFNKWICNLTPEVRNIFIK